MTQRLWRLLVPAAVAAALAAPRAEERLHRQSRPLMGSLAEIQAYHADAALAERAIAAALDEMARVDRLLSNYRADSELSRMNAAAARAPFPASAELFAFLQQCRALFEQTAGTFDPTVGAVVRAWGFFTRHPARPTAAEAAAAKARAGFDKVRLDAAARTVSYAVDGLELDPGGIGKGYAADRAVAVLKAFGVASALVSAGGSTIAALGHPPGQEGWKVAIRDPARPMTALRHVRLRDSAVSTSGASQNFVDAEGKRFGHIIDPRTGEPGQGVCQVTVIAPTAADSDAFTKPAYLLPHDALQRLFDGRRGIHVLRVDGACGSGGAVWITPWSSGVFLNN
jgi:thiamine biosynthesis lipoprotein